MREMSDDENDELQIIDVKDEIEKEKKKRKRKIKLFMRFELRTTVSEQALSIIYRLSNTVINIAMF